MLDEIRKQEVIKLCQELLRIQSYSGQEKALVDHLENVMKQLGFDSVSIDKYGSIVGSVKGKKPGKKLLFDGHIDTVPVPEPSVWKHQPFGGELDGERIYGRGASDMKGAVAAMICAAAYLAADSDKNFEGEILVAGTVQEECFEGIAARETTAKYKPDYVVIGEASALNLKRGQRGRAEIVVETFGIPAHSASPEKGCNAVYQMTALVEELKKLEFSSDPFLGKGIMVLTDIISSPYPGASVVPSYCRATFDRRLLVGETGDEVLGPLQELINTLKDRYPDFNAKVSFAKGAETCYTGTGIEAERYFPAWLYEEDAPFVQRALKGIREQGLEPEITKYSFCTNGSHYAGEAGIETIGFGPSEETLAHIIDEYIEVEQLLGACRGYYGIMKSVLNG